MQTFKGGEGRTTLTTDADGLDSQGTLGGKLDHATAQPLFTIGPGLPALSKRLVEKIRVNEFAELPPAKGKSRPLSQAGEGHVVVVQAADLLQSRKIIPDLATWQQCFSLYVAVLTPQQPERIPELMAYQAIIAKTSMKYKWPSWIVYD